MANYGNIVKSTQTGKSGGYKNALYLSPIKEIDVWKRPAAIPAALGDKYKITTAHTWVEGAATYKWEANIHSVNLKSATVGDPGAQELEHTLEIKFSGDNAATYEQIVNALNDDVAIWIKEADCINNDSYIQLGDDCVPVELSAAFDSSNTQTGQKVYTITIKSKKKFFYLAALDVTA